MENELKIKTIKGAFDAIYRRLPQKSQRQFWLLLTYMILVSLVGTGAVGAIALFAATFSSPEEVMSSKAVGFMQDNFSWAFLSDPQGLTIALSLVMVAAIALKNIMECIQYYWVARYGATAEAFFGTRLFKGFLEMPYQWHLNRNSADLVLALQWRSYIGHSFINTALTAISDIFLVSFLLLTLFIVSVKVSFAVLLLAGTAALVIYKKIHQYQEIEAEKCKHYVQMVHRDGTKGIHGIKDVKVSGETMFLDDFSNNAYQMARIQGMRMFFGKLPLGLLETTGFILLSLSAIALMFWSNVTSAVTMGVISLLVVSAWRILPAVSRVMASLLSVRNILPFISTEIDYLNHIENNEKSVSLDAGSTEPIEFEHSIKLNDVGFHYDNRPATVLEGISFKIEKGQTIGIVGHSGVGKSTLIDLIIGLLKPSQGEITIDDRPLNGNNLRSWMKNLSYVSQAPYICDGTIADNIAFGVSNKDIDRERVLRCCSMAHMDDIIEKLPEGIDTLIGERGVRLSGGQRQRVAIARALYTDPKLIIFDEATSSLDGWSERSIQETISSLKGRRTIIIVAHRLKTVEQCDLIVWLKDGKIKMIDKPNTALDQYEASLS